MPFDNSRLRIIRNKRKVSLRKLAKMLGIPYQSIQEYERGKVKPGADRLEQLVNALDTNMDYLMARSSYDGKRTEDHDRVATAFDSGDIDTIIALIGKQVRKQEPPENRAARRPPRTKK